MKDYGRKLRATGEFAAERGWTLLSSMRSDAEQRTLLEQLHGEPFHPPERSPDSYPYPVLGRHEHLLSNVMRGTYRGRSAVVFAYTRRQEVLDDSFGRRGWESSTYWIAALLDLPVPVTRLQVTPRTPVVPEHPGITVGDPRIDEHFHVHSPDPLWAARELRAVDPVLLNGPGRAWRISGTSILTWTWTYQSASGIPLDQVDAALERLSAIAEHFTSATGRAEP
jgi:hypothetical protein